MAAAEVRQRRRRRRRSPAGAPSRRTKISSAYGPVTACIASKRMRKPPPRSSAPIASKSNSVASSSAWSATGSITSTVIVAELRRAERGRGRRRARRACGSASMRSLRAPDRLGDLLRRRAAVAGVVLDAEVAVGPARVVARRQDDAAERARACGSTQLAAGVDRMPPRPTSTRPKPFAAAMRTIVWIATSL